jgi:hypothetical protein
VGGGVGGGVGAGVGSGSPPSGQRTASVRFAMMFGNLSKSVTVRKKPPVPQF